VSAACAPTAGPARVLQPDASVKDRIGVAMIDALEAQGRIAAGRGVIIERRPATPARARLRLRRAGYKLILVIPSDVDGARRMLGAARRRAGADPRSLGMKGAIAKANELVAATPGG